MHTPDTGTFQETVLKRALGQLSIFSPELPKWKAFPCQLRSAPTRAQPAPFLVKKRLGRVVGVDGFDVAAITMQLPTLRDVRVLLSALNSNS